MLYNPLECNHVWEERQKYIEGSVFNDSRTYVKHYRCIKCNMTREDREELPDEVRDNS